jgi:hypothetical protein
MHGHKWQRRDWLKAAIALMVPAGAARAAPKSVELPCEKVFAYLKDYYGLPASERGLFRMAYFAQITNVNTEDLSLSLKHKGQTVPLSLGKEGLISPLPSAQALNDKATLILSAPEGAKLAFSIRLELMPAFAPEARMEVAALKPAMIQAAKGVKKAAGLMAMAVPDYDTLIIRGIGAGEVVLKDGSRRPLPLRPALTAKNGTAVPAMPYFTPARWPEAVAIQFAKAPDFVLIVPAPKT